MTLLNPKLSCMFFIPLSACQHVFEKLIIIIANATPKDDQYIKYKKNTAYVHVVIIARATILIHHKPDCIAHFLYFSQQLWLLNASCIKMLLVIF